MYEYDISSSSAALGASGGLFAGLAAMMGVMMLVILAIYVVMIIGMWKLFVKAGREGWKSIIPLYNMYVLTEISGQNGLLFLLCLIPGVGALIWSIMVSIKLAPAFGKDTGFAIGLILLAPIFYLILGFGSAQYQLGNAPAAGDKAAAPAAPAAKPEDPWVNGQQPQA